VPIGKAAIRRKGSDVSIISVAGCLRHCLKAADALAKDGIRFADAYSQVPLTLPSHASLLSGLLPPDNGVRSNIGYVYDGGAHPTLATMLRLMDSSCIRR